MNKTGKGTNKDLSFIIIKLLIAWNCIYSNMQKTVLPNWQICIIRYNLHNDGNIYKHTFQTPYVPQQEACTKWTRLYIVIYKII